MAHVTIGPNFFAKAKNDYACWKWALVREFMQNSLDCGSKKIQIDVRFENGETFLTVFNDGEPMTEQIITEKLLSLGSSGKGFQGTVGGFGKAKELLYFCHKNYSIRTGNFEVLGSGAEYDIEYRPFFFPGTKSKVVISGKHDEEIQKQFKLFAYLCNVKCQIIVNDQEIAERLSSGKFRRELTFGKVYTNKLVQNLAVVRIGGTPMFSTYCKFDGCVVVELEGQSSEVLTSNRDGLRYDPRTQFESFIQDICTNKRKALEQKKTEYLRFGGNKVKCKGFKQHQKEIVIAGRTINAEDLKMDKGFEFTINPEGLNRDQYNIVEETAEQKIESKAHKIASSFIIKNETENQVQVWYRPDSEKFGKYAYKLIMVWTKLLVKMHEILGWDDEFSVGFIFTDNGCIAEYEQDGPNGKIYYINPVVIGAGGRQSARYTLSDREQFNQLIATAAHELVHGMGYGDHDENYAAKLTECFGKLITHNKDLQKCIKV